MRHNYYSKAVEVRYDGLRLSRFDIAITPVTSLLANQHVASEPVKRVNVISVKVQPWTDRSILVFRFRLASSNI